MTDLTIPGVKRIKERHHFVARLVAAGKPPLECSVASGYAIGTIYGLAKDPAFLELVEYYRSLEELEFRSVAEKQALVRDMALNELMDRLENDGESFGNRDLMELGMNEMERMERSGNVMVQLNFGGKMVEVE